MMHKGGYTIHSTKILGIAGSLRANSNSTRGLKELLENASTKYFAETSIVDLREDVLPIFDPSNRSEDRSSCHECNKKNCDG